MLRSLARPALAQWLLPTALAVASGASSAQASAPSSVQLYGVFDLAVTSRQLSGNARTQELQNGAVTTSYLGLRGSENLGQGYRALFGLESFLRADTGDVGRSGADGFWARNSWVGLGLPAGTLRFGRQTTPAFMLAGRANPFGGATGVGPFMMQTYLTSATQPMITGGGASDSAWSNSMGFTSNELAGFTFSALVAAGEGTTAGRRFSVAGTYASGPFTAGLVLERLNRMALPWGAPTAALATAARPQFTASEVSSTHAGLTYDFGGVKAYAQAVRSALDNTANIRIQLNTTQLGLLARAGSSADVLLSWVHTTKDQTNAAALNRNGIAVGYDYRLSRRTDAYAVLLHDKVSNLNKGQTLAVGVRHTY